MASVLLLGFSSGLPLALTAGTLQAWMTLEKVDLRVIGIFSLVGLPYTLKFLWSPIMDRFVPPFLGRRRGWLLILQLALAVGIAGMAFAHPAEAPATMAALAFVVVFFSASQDIVIDAYRAEILPEEELGAGAGVFIMGYRVAMIVSGAIALILASKLPWHSVYLIMALCMAVGIATTLFIAPEPEIEGKPPKSIREAVVLPFIQFFKRTAAGEIVGFILLYKLDVVIAVAMTTPFLLNMGFSTADIGEVSKGFGVISAIVGGLAGGAIMIRLGMFRSLWLFGILQAVSNLTFMLLAHLGHNYPVMVASIVIENLCTGMGNAALLAFMMAVCDKRYTATQYALLSSLMAVGRVFAGAPTGYLAKYAGWEIYFLVATVACVPGLLLLLRYPVWMQGERPQGALPEAAT